ncbi:MAG: HEPN domain-containing protein [Muribaculaceae bacterium]|nr:HEPN domain-containing protein [Muribaculaceae bacterium]
MTLKSDERSAIIEYRLEKAVKTLREAKDIGGIGYWTLAANRLYYAAYYASASLLIHHGIDASTHKGVIRMIGKNFINNSILKIEDSQLLGRLFTMRQSGDYDDLFDWSEKDVAPLIPEVENYIQRISKLIETSAE